MNRNVENTDMFRRAKKLVKRISITILCCIPFILIFAYLTRNVITSDAAQIVCFIAIMGGALRLLSQLQEQERRKRQNKHKLNQSEMCLNSSTSN